MLSTSQSPFLPQQRGKFRPNLVNLVQMNTPRVVMQETKKAFRNIFKREDLQSGLTAMCNLKGVGPAMASGRAQSSKRLAAAMAVSTQNGEIQAECSMWGDTGSTGGNWSSGGGINSGSLIHFTPLSLETSLTITHVFSLSLPCPPPLSLSSGSGESSFPSSPTWSGLTRRRPCRPRAGRPLGSCPTSSRA